LLLEGSFDQALLNLGFAFGKAKCNNHKQRRKSNHHYAPDCDEAVSVDILAPEE